MAPLVFGLLLSGCLHEQRSAGAALLEGDSSKLLLSLADTGFDAVEPKEFATAEEASGGTEASAALFRERGFVKGYRNSFTKVGESDYKKLVHDVYLFSSAKGATGLYAILRESLAQVSESISPLEVPELGDGSFGVKGTRQLQAGGAAATVADYIIIFVKRNAVETLDYYGLEQSLSEQEALELARKAAAKAS